MNDHRSRPTDAELRVARLNITDPYNQDRLVWVVPANVSLVEILNTYTFERWPEEKCLCVQCDGHRHKHGFTVVLSSGDKVLLGSKCGLDVFGETWTQAHNRLRGLRKRQDMLVRLDDLLPRIPAILDGLLRWHGPCDHMRKVRLRFSKLMPALYYGLRRATKHHNGSLMVYEKVRHLAAEAERREGDPDEPVYTWVHRVYHKMQGAAFFWEADPVDVVNQTISILHRIQKAAEQTDGMETADMASLDRSLRGCFRQLRDVVAMYRASLDFFEPSNLTMVAKWATFSSEIRGSYYAEGRTLSAALVNGGVSLPESYPGPDVSVLELLWRPEAQSPASVA